MRRKIWTTTVDNVTYNIEFTTKLLKKELLVNSSPISLEPSKTFGITRETAFNLGNKTAILVTIDKEADVAIDGIYLGSGMKYVTVKYMPNWNYIFLGLILLIFISSYNSICAALFTLIGLYFLIRISLEPSFKTKQRILLCSFITLSMHLFFWNVLFILLTIL
ncbi:hypothetical protein [uncultured Clostridium sp.]|uniref:hypothetical protein n=1 Tax=uncultured Clostridium sp. TaxID=59620 RepID=UPI0028EC9213|nr:hypothetical protein [uncultured Clostridium sp.]